MAKKTKSNFGKVICDVLTVLFGGLFLGLLALPHISTLISGNAVSDLTFSGYDLINFDKGSDTGRAAVLLMLVIFVCLMILFALVKLLCDLKVIKKQNVSKIAGFLMVGSALIVVVLAVVNIITVATSCSAEKGPITGELSGTVAGFAALIVNTIVALFAFVSSLFATVKKK